MPATWNLTEAGVLQLPSGRLVRGRGLRSPAPHPPPTFGLYLQARQSPTFPWESRWSKWPDFWLPSERAVAPLVLREAWERASDERVEIACGGGRGLTGTALHS